MYRKCRQWDEQTSNCSNIHLTKIRNEQNGDYHRLGIWNISQAGRGIASVVSVIVQLTLTIGRANIHLPEVIRFDFS
jgi:hypothetical protein